MAELNPLVLARERPTRARAIKAMCAHCMGCTQEHLEPGFRDLIRGCTATGCPLYPFRPYSSPRRSKPPKTQEQ